VKEPPPGRGRGQTLHCNTGDHSNKNPIFILNEWSFFIERG
jgi:hypothetical protein